MKRTIRNLIALAGLTAGAAWGQLLSVSCSPTTLPEVVQTIVSVTCSASNGLAPYSWSISAGQLPPGLTQHADGTITGTLQDPAGAYAFTVMASDSTPILPLTGAQSYSGTTVDPLNVTCTKTNGPLEVGIQYTNACSASGGTGPYTWSVNSAPPGLAVSQTGVVTDLPASPVASYQYRVLATDSSNPTKLTKGVEFTGAIAPAVTIGTPSTLPGASVGNPYSLQFAVTTGSGASPFTWTATGLPSWLGMSASGLLTSTSNPPATGNFQFTAMVTDAAGGSDSGTFSLTVSQGITITTTSPLPPATAGVAYSQPFGATGGSGGYTWTVSGQPGWLTMTPAGVLGGSTPLTAVTSTFTVKVTDSSNNSTSGQFTLPVTFAITTNSPLTTATIGQPYNQALTAVGGAGGYTWSVTSGSTLPSWLTLTGATLTATTVPATATNSSFSLTVTDSSNASVTAPFTLPVNLVIVPPASLTAAIGSAFNQTFTAEGGAGGYTWSATGLPSWLTLSAAGVLSSASVPATALDSNFTVKVTDSAKGTVSGQYTVTVPLAITTPTTLPPATVNTSYTATFAAQGGAGGYTWTSTQLPAWATLSTAGVLTGQPTTTGPVSFPVTVTDSLSVLQTATFTLAVNLPALTITTSGLANGAVGETQYNQTLTGTGGMPPYSWSLATNSGPLPNGLSLTSNASGTGTISGTPNKAGAFTFTIQLTDSATPTPSTTTKAFTVTISAGLTITTAAALPNATVGLLYSQTLAAAGGVPPYTWAPVGPVVAAPSPLSTISLSAAGVISGTPTVTGSGTFAITVTDNAGTTSLPVTFSLAIVTAPVINTTTLPGGSVGVNYSQTLAASGGTKPYTWSLLSGSLPGGLSLSPTGTIGGLPNAAGAASFTVQLTDATGVTAKQALTIAIIASLTISTASPLPTGEVGIHYSQTLAATGGTAPYTWAITGGVLPQGLSLSPAGSITGTPGAAGTASVKVQVTDSDQLTATATLALTIDAPVSVSTPATLNGGSLNSSYSQSLAASGGVAPYTWTLTNPTTAPLPPGLNLSPAGVISGTPTSTGTFTFSITVTDSVGGAASRAFTIVVVVGLDVTTPATLPSGTVGVAYSLTLQASGGTPPYSWSTSSGTPPAGLAVSRNGNLSGVPTAPGPFSFTVQVTDNAGHQATELMSLAVAPALIITTTSLPGGTAGGSYSQTLAATGGTPPYMWSLVTGTLPPLVALSPAGSITGTTTTAGTYSFNVLVTDSAGVTQNKQLSIVVAGGGVSITTAATLPNGSVNASYSQTLAATGGTPPYTWAVTGGALPGGLALSPGGVISGSPTAAGTFQFTATVTDSASLTAKQQFTIVIAGLSITTTTLPSGAVGTSYSQTLAASGTGPYTWTVTAGTLPAGLSLDPTSGTISGTPSAAGSATVTIKVTDSTNASSSSTFTLTVIAASFTALPSTATSAQQLSFALTPGAAFAQGITGQVTLAFQPSSSLASPVDDPAIQFSAGGSAASFTIPAGSTTPIALSLQTGTVAGTITLTVTWQAGGATLAVPAALTQTITIAPAAPVITGVTASTSSDGFTVVVTGYSNTRETTQALLQFTPAAGQTLQTTNLPVPLTSAATAWFQSNASDQYGSQFVLTLPFNVTSGSASAIGSISVQLVNTQGTSNSANATL